MHDSCSEPSDTRINRKTTELPRISKSKLSLEEHGTTLTRMSRTSGRTSIFRNVADAGTLEMKWTCTCAGKREMVCCFVGLLIVVTFVC